MKTILVVGATGQQGRSLIQALCQSNDYLCLALTRNTSSPKAQNLTLLGNVHLVSGDLNDIDQIRSLFSEAKSDARIGEIWGVFVALAFPGLGANASQEENQGKNIATVSNDFGVHSFVFSSVIPFYSEDKPPPPGLDRYTKIALEKYVATLDMPWTIIRPGIFMENFSPGFIGRLTGGVILHSVPAECKLQFVTVYDIGRLSRVIFDDPSKARHKIMDIAGDSLTPQELNQAFIRATGHNIPSVPRLLIALIAWLNPSTGDAMKEFLQADELRRQDPNGYDANLREAASLLNLTTVEEWVRLQDQRALESTNNNSVTIWGLITGRL